MADLKDPSQDSHSKENDMGTQHLENVNQAVYPTTPGENLDFRNVNAILANPLAGYSNSQLMQMGEDYVRKHEIGNEEDIRAFRLAAIIAKDPLKFDTVDGLTKEELLVLKEEFTQKWRQPKLLYIVIVLCSTCAAVQGMGISITYSYNLTLLTILKMKPLSMELSCFTQSSLE